jgi:dihydrofolate reductase
MRQLTVFNHATLDGYFTDANNDMSWAHRNSDDAEWTAFVSGNASSGGELLFGRVTYDLMASYWPTPLATKNDPVVAERMNALPKVVFSRTLTKPTWRNTRLVNGDIEAAVRGMKAEPGDGMVIMGSGTIVSQLAQAGLIDVFQIVVNPIVLGKGRSMFADVRRKLDLKLTQSRAFQNGKVVLTYQPA